MIKNKKRFKPHILLAHEALFRSLHDQYRFNETIQSDYHRYRAGFYGEKQIDYKLSLFPNPEFYHLPSLRLQNNFHFFQIDSVILTPKLIFNIEVKNLKGTLEYNAAARQLIQYDDKKQTCYKDPLLQADTQRIHLHYWLQQYSINIPIEPIVVSTNPNTIIRNPENDSEFQHRFVTLENFLHKLDQIYNSYHKTVLTIKEIQKLYRKLAKNNTPLISNLIDYYQIKKQHLISGIPCTSCQFYPLEKKYKTWICPKCSQIFPDVHKRIILDYFLLHQPVITNSICRKLLRVPSPNTAYNILKSLHLKTTGSNKNRKYLAPELWEYPQHDAPKYIHPSIF